MSIVAAIRARVRAEYLPAAVAVCVYTVVVLQSAWLCDDAYITFRTVDNFVHGHGLTWNVAERVQAYTHPLWMLLLSAIGWLTQEIYYTSIFLCVGISIATVLLFTARVAVAALPALIGMAILVLSQAFVDYSTSGLENPLAHLLLVLFLLVYLTRPVDRRTLLWLSLLAGLATLNRMDNILLLLPALCVGFYRADGGRWLGTVLLGFAPFIAWELFALFYYGSPVPNTAYAKLNTGVPAGEMIRQGLLYLLATLKSDPLTAIVIVAGPTLPLVARERRHLPVTLGILLYLLYVVRVGGDFMLGRFLTPPLLISVVLLSRLTLSNRTGVIMLLLVALIGIAPICAPFVGGGDSRRLGGYLPDRNGICDERAFYGHATGLFRAGDDAELPDHSLGRQGRDAAAEGEPVVLAKRIGMFGFFAGPEVHVVDQMALADPLLARLKPQIEDGWRIGHFRRRIPEGYLETLKAGRNYLTDSWLAVYYDKLALITRGDLWDPQRWLEIAKFNLGVYDELRAAPQPHSW